MLFDTIAAWAALDELLDHEREMILAGKIDGLARSAHQKELLAARLPNTDDDTMLARIRRKAERNQALLASAARGLKAARDRIEKIAAGRPPLRTYGANGAAQNIGDAARTTGVNHRA